MSIDHDVLVADDDVHTIELEVELLKVSPSPIIPFPFTLKKVLTVYN